jgi:hypothetical protein
MPVLYFLFYALGAFFLAFTVGDAVLDVVAGGDPLQETGLVTGVFFVTVGVAPHLLSDLLADDDTEEADAHETDETDETDTAIDPGFAIGGGAIWILSLIAPWAQFELYWNPVRMSPFVSVLAAAAMVAGVHDTARRTDAPSAASPAWSRSAASPFRSVPCARPR